MSQKDDKWKSHWQEDKTPVRKTIDEVRDAFGATKRSVNESKAKFDTQATSIQQSASSYQNYVQNNPEIFSIPVAGLITLLVFHKRSRFAKLFASIGAMTVMTGLLFPNRFVPALEALKQRIPK
eukprot:TRINITY_DN13499_c0_g1_i1.p1 TRINITY_DN13499_c0_g1~~TRINITY_DN13499_c0_g1_i1.p1  ORF type:complete len:124 (-),score=27.29 TRINITY_DN13499_c0_g1_i1:136-507(-)